LNGGWGCRTQFLKGHTQEPSTPSLAPFGQAVSEEKIFLTLANQKKELFFIIIIIIIILYRGPYIDAYCQVWFHLAKLFQRIR
jgi:hypothetical protein